MYLPALMTGIQVKKKTNYGTTYFSRCQTRCVTHLPVLLVLSLFCIINIATPLFEQDKLELSSIYLGWSKNTASERTYEIAFQVIAIFLHGASSFSSLWLAGKKYKLQSIITLAILLVCLGVVGDVLISIVLSAKGYSNRSTWVVVLNYITTALITLGNTSVFTNMLQFTIEQVPGASSVQISSLVSWFLFCIYFGKWLSKFIQDLLLHCIASETLVPSDILLLLKLFFAAFLALSVSLYLLYKHKLLDNSPISDVEQNIYKVLQYAYKHKFPERRSAFTYWEDKPTSRLCHGKKKYGGPFTNEEVEDVKSFILISLLLLIFFLYYLVGSILSNSLYAEIMSGSNNSLKFVDYSMNKQCTKSIIFSFVGTFMLWMWVFIVAYEFVLIPVFSNKIPNIMKRLSLTSISIALTNIVLIVIVSLKNYSGLSGIVYLFGLQLGLSPAVGVFVCLLFISLYEFICAQSPYTMRSYFIGVLMWCNWSSNLIAGTVFKVLEVFCTSKTCYFTYITASFCLYILGLVLFNVSIKQYRKRSRGHEDEHQQVWVEEAYGKYVNYYPFNDEMYSCGTE